MAEHTYTVLLTNDILAEEADRLRLHANVIVAPQADPGTLRRLVADADALIVRAKLPDDIFDYQTRLKGVVRHGVGLDMIPMKNASARKIPVANIPGCNTRSVVEYCVAAMLLVRRRIDTQRIENGGSDWQSRRELADQMGELGGLTLGIVGVGAIGGALANVATALGMKVIGLSRRRESLPDGVAYADKQALFSQADIVVLSCPLNADTIGLVDTAELNAMKTSGILINVSRGPVINTAALMNALDHGKIAAAVLDVHDVQPVKPGMYPAEQKNLYLTPHIAGITTASMKRMSQGAVDEVLRLLHGQRFANLVNPEIYD
ncbi:MAG TPA: NAD(P)-dependent oxidoreductase [Advenella sp.]|nr:NAD(P)-dependent oxidoreductase [Advenella sp.]